MEKVSDVEFGVPAQVPNGEASQPNPSAGQILDNVPRRSSKGGYTTTTQVSLKPKRVDSTASTTTSIYDATDDAIDHEGFANVSHLQPADGGFGAWSYLVVAFSMFVVVWGFPQSFPIFQTFLSSGAAAKYPKDTLLLLLSPGLQDIEEGILFQLLPKSAKDRKMLVIIGISIMMTALVLASCANTAWQIFLTLGVLFGAGGIMLNFVHVSVFPEWFEKKQSMAMKNIWLGYRFGALIFPPACQFLLNRHGFEKTLRVLIAPMLSLLLPCVILLRGRFPAANVRAESVHPPISKVAVLTKPNVMFYLLVAVLFFSVVNVPRMFISTFAEDLKLAPWDRSLGLSLHVASNLLATQAIGWLSDTVFYDGLIAGCAVSTSLVHILIWGYVKNRFGLFLYAISSGLTSAGFSTCLYAIYSEVSGTNKEHFLLVHSLFSFFRGIAVVSVGPVGMILLQQSPEVVADSYAIGKYKYLVAYAGGMSMASGLLIILRIGLHKRVKV